MAKIEQFKCDVCGKTEENGGISQWFEAIRMPSSVTPVVVIWPFTGTWPDGICRLESPVKHCCGQQCALAFISAQMAGGK
jgi:hypothetical protein